MAQRSREQRLAGIARLLPATLSLCFTSSSVLSGCTFATARTETAVPRHGARQRLGGSPNVASASLTTCGASQSESEDRWWSETACDDSALPFPEDHQVASSDEYDSDEADTHFMRSTSSDDSIFRRSSGARDAWTRKRAYSTPTARGEIPIDPSGARYSAFEGGQAEYVLRHQSRPRPRRAGAVASSCTAAASGLLKNAAGVAVFLAVIAPLARALSSHWPYFVAGGVCAAVSHTAAVPLDVIKTRIQCADPGEYSGTWDALIRICKSEGARVLFCGAGATLVGYALQGFLKFGFFEFLKPQFSSLFVGGDAADTPVLGSLVAASVAAEVVGSSALTPLEAARIRMVSDAEYASGLRAGIARMISEEGMSALTRGLPAVLAKQIPYTVTKLVTFDYLVRSVSAALCLRGGGSTVGGSGGGGLGATTCCAVAAGMLSSLASQPGDSLLSALNSEGGQAEGHGSGRIARESATRSMARIARTAGFSGLFRGTTARMMHVTSIVTIQLLIYQTVKSMVGITT